MLAWTWQASAQRKGSGQVSEDPCNLPLGVEVLAGAGNFGRSQWAVLAVLRGRKVSLDSGSTVGA